MRTATHSATGLPIHVYLTHSRVDDVFARKIRNLLFGLNTRVVIREDLSVSDQWESELRKELSSADVVLALLTPRAVDDPWVLRELGAAWAIKKPIIPVVTRRDVLNRIPISVEGSHRIELPDIDSTENEDKFVEEFEQSLGAVHVG